MARGYEHSYTTNALPSFNVYFESNDYSPLPMPWQSYKNENCLFFCVSTNTMGTSPAHVKDSLHQFDYQCCMIAVLLCTHSKMIPFSRYRIIYTFFCPSTFRCTTKIDTCKPHGYGRITWFLIHTISMLNQQNMAQMIIIHAYSF